MLDHQHGPDGSIFSMHPKKKLEILGKKTVIIRTSTNDTRRATVALTITAAGNQLVPMVVYKGTENCTIMKRELQHHHPTCIYETQENAWIDERVMLRWVEDVLVPYVALAPPGIIPLILLDSYCCHIMALVVNVIQDLGCKVVHIPGGCTGLVSSRPQLLSFRWAPPQARQHHHLQPPPPLHHH
jgi:hypothetical protein